MDKNNNMQGVIHFPCHSKEKIIVYKGASGKCSIKCPYCSRFAIFDFSMMRSEETKAARGTIHNLTSQNTYID